MCIPVLRYRHTDLYQLKSGAGSPPPNTITLLKDVGIFHYRGRRGGRRVQRNIPTIKSTKCKTDRKYKPQVRKQYNVLEVPRLWYTLPSILLSNVTSLSNKVEEVSVAVKSVNASIVAITEAWQIVPELCQIENYELFHHLRTDRRGGGVVVYCRSDLQPAQLQVNVPDGVEATWVRVTPSAHPRHLASLIVCVAYHPPRSPTADELITHIIDTADFLRSQFPCSKLVICGDFNQLNINSITHHLNLEQIVNFPTHGHSILDLIMTDLGPHFLPPQPLPPMGRSPHLSVLWSPAPTTSPPPPITKTYRPTPDSAIRRFGSWVTHYPWTEVLTVEDVQDKWNNYQDTIMAAFHHFFPTKTLKYHPDDMPWITPRIKRLILQRNKAFYTNENMYKPLRNQVIREIKAAKKTYYPRKIHSLKHQNISQWYTKVKDLCGLNRQSSAFPFVTNMSNQDAAETINDHFATICQTLPSLDLTTLPAYLPSPSPPPSVQPFQIASKLLKFKSKRSTTPIDLPVKIYKEFSVELATPLCSILNASLNQCKSPSQWKTAYVTPIPKTPTPTSPSELRPIAITPLPSLLCEDFVYEWAYNSIKQSIDPEQYGNVRTSSTSHYLISFLDFLHRNLDKRKTSLAVAFIDFKKAFDLVDHGTVLKKAISLGLPTSLVSWLSDFLSSRSQVVRYRGAVSTPRPLTCGVPQGTKMGPLCFLILINDALSDTALRWKYVDDCTVGTVVDNNSPDYTPLQDILDNLLSWTTENKVTINYNKSVVMHFNTATTQVQAPTVTVNDHPLQLVQSTKLLGITIDSKLEWNEHVNNTIKAASFRLFMLRRLKSLGATTPVLSTIFTSFILPKLTYASQAWTSSLNITQMRRLEKVQKRACRIILGADYTGYDSALTTLQMPTLSLLYQQTLSTFGSKLLHHPRHRHLLPPAVPRPSRALRHSNIIQPIRARTDRYKKSSIPTITRVLNNTQAV